MNNVYLYISLIACELVYEIYLLLSKGYKSEFGVSKVFIWLHGQAGSSITPVNY